jgi:hypothetical protein
MFLIMEVKMSAPSDSAAEKPRVKFCWNCGRKLYGNKFATRVIEGFERVLHKECAERPELVARDDEVLAGTRGER